jgi:hypothetical protein
LECGLRTTDAPCIVVEFEPKVPLVAEERVGVMALEVVPDLFHWIELGGIAGKRFHVKSGIVLLQLGNEGSFVDRAIVPQQDNRSPYVS